MIQPATQSASKPTDRADDGDPDGLLIQAARDDPENFARLYDRYAKTLYRYLLSKTGSVAEAEDLTSQTFLCALEKLPGYRHQGYFNAWLFGIAHNKWVDYYRHKKRPLPSMGWQPDALDPDFLQGIIHEERAHLLGGLVKKLPEDQRELLRLRLVAELRFEEVAHYLQRSEAAVKKEYYRLIDRMKQEMEQIYG